jgi:hypothetical protein
VLYKRKCFLNTQKDFTDCEVHLTVKGYVTNFFKFIIFEDLMDRKVHLTVKDYVTWFLIVGMVFLVWMWAGNWGAPPRPISPDASPVSQYVFAPYAVVYTGAGVVTALFLGSMIFFVYKFREREGYGEG